MLAVRGRTETELYLTREVQEVYKSQGVDINDKHIELIVRQMMKKVRVDQKGDTNLLPGEFVDRNEFSRINQGVIEARGEAAQAEEIILRVDGAEFPDASMAGRSDSYAVVEFGGAYASLDLELNPHGA